jgi:hypothetical protein
MPNLGGAHDERRLRLTQQSNLGGFMVLSRRKAQEGLRIQLVSDRHSCSALGTFSGNLILI